MTDLEKQRVAVLRSQGQSYGAIADALHVSVNSVKTFCRRNHGYKQDYSTAYVFRCQGADWRYFAVCRMAP